MFVRDVEPSAAAGDGEGEAKASRKLFTMQYRLEDREGLAKYAHFLPMLSIAPANLLHKRSNHANPECFCAVSQVH